MQNKGKMCMNYYEIQMMGVLTNARSMVTR